MPLRAVIRPGAWALSLRRTFGNPFAGHGALLLTYFPTLGVVAAVAVVTRDGPTVAATAILWTVTARALTSRRKDD
jgi:hypothetical protein